jgi:hypothetical protein
VVAYTQSAVSNRSIDGNRGGEVDPQPAMPTRRLSEWRWNWLGLLCWSRPTLCDLTPNQLGRLLGLKTLQGEYWKVYALYA